MSTEFVVVDNGIETDYIDPVVSVKETDKAWVVNNSYATFEIAKKPGRTVLERTIETRP